jgi:hypothetical protein
LVLDTSAAILEEYFAKPPDARIAIARIPAERNYYAESAGAVDGARDVHLGRELFPEPAVGHGDLLTVAKGLGFSP